MDKIGLSISFGSPSVVTLMNEYVPFNTMKDISFNHKEKSKCTVNMAGGAFRGRKQRAKKMSQV